MKSIVMRGNNKLIDAIKEEAYEMGTMDIYKEEKEDGELESVLITYDNIEKAFIAEKLEERKGIDFMQSLDKAKAIIKDESYIEERENFISKFINQ